MHRVQRIKVKQWISWRLTKSWAIVLNTGLLIAFSSLHSLSFDLFRFIHLETYLRYFSRKWTWQVYFLHFSLSSDFELLGKGMTFFNVRYSKISVGYYFISAANTYNYTCLICILHSIFHVEWSYHLFSRNTSHTDDIRVHK